jgi:hypothetical protein
MSLLTPEYNWVSKSNIMRLYLVLTQSTAANQSIDSEIEKKVYMSPLYQDPVNRPVRSVSMAPWFTRYTVNCIFT